MIRITHIIAITLTTMMKKPTRIPLRPARSTWTRALSRALATHRLRPRLAPALTIAAAIPRVVAITTRATSATSRVARARTSIK